MSASTILSLLGQCNGIWKSGVIPGAVRREAARRSLDRVDS